jgi:hypothetical protein
MLPVPMTEGKNAANLAFIDEESGNGRSPDTRNAANKKEKRQRQGGKDHKRR